jgi:hypothetical protein
LNHEGHEEYEGFSTKVQKLAHQLVDAGNRLDLLVENLIILEVKRSRR